MKFIIREDKLDSIVDSYLTKQFENLEYVKDGKKDVWTYDLDKNPSGPISVEFFYPKGYNHVLDYTDRDNHWIPVAHRTYINPKNGKEVSHNKAVKLGLAR